MSFSIGLDIGGTKIAGAVFDDKGEVLTQNAVPTPTDYADFLAACGELISEFDKACKQKAKIGIGIAGMIDSKHGTVFAPNIPCLEGRPFRSDCEKTFGRAVRVANDADCAALVEACDGAGQGYRTVFGLIMGTGVGGGLVIDGKIFEGAHGLAGEIGHLPLPFRDAADGPLVDCGCGQKGCIDKSIGGPALARLYKAMTGKQAEAEHIAIRAREGDTEARRVLDQFYTTVAKAMVTVIHSFDPDIIVVSGGLNDLPSLYNEVPKRWGRYALCKALCTKFAAAKYGAISGIRGAARIGR